MVGYGKGNRMRGIDISIFAKKLQNRTTYSTQLQQRQKQELQPQQRKQQQQHMCSPFYHQRTCDTQHVSLDGMQQNLPVDEMQQNLPVDEMQQNLPVDECRQPPHQVKPLNQCEELEHQESDLISAPPPQDIVNHIQHVEQSNGDSSSLQHEISKKHKKVDMKRADMKKPPVNNSPTALSISNLSDLDICAICQCVMSVDCHRITMSCNQCGFTQALVDPNSLMQATPYYNLEKKDTLLSHVRLRKLRDYMKHVFSKHKSVVPMQLLIDISRSLTTKMGIMSWSDLQFHHITALLETETSFKKFECYKMQIYCRLKGCNPPQLHPEQEEALVVLFVAIQGPFERLKKNEKSTFFTMSYIFYVLCKFLNYDDLLKYISIKRTRSKLQTQQDLLKAIFDELKWEPFPFI